jgi:curved DNA-binding protein CbpA
MSNIEDLINQMNPKRDPSEININKKTSTDRTTKTIRDTESSQSEEKFKSTLKENDFDYYKILGIDQNATQLEIKRAYQAKLKKLHPDHAPQTKENKAKYKLVREAGDILSDPYERKAYDAQRKMDLTSKDHKSQKDSFKEFLKLQEQHMTDEDKAIAKLNFDRGLSEMDRKHNFNRKELEEKALSKEEYDRKMDDYILQRDQQDRELEQENMFEGRDFDTMEFNKRFLEKKKRDEKRKKKQGGLAKIDDIMAANDFEEGTAGVSIDNYDSLYSEGNFGGFNENYAGLGSGMLGNDDGRSDDISIDTPEENDDYDTHNKGVTKESLDAAMKKMMADRSEQDDTFKKYDTNDYGSALDDKFGISKQFGFMIGTDKFGHQKHLKSKVNVKEETLKAYKQLTEK